MSLEFVVHLSVPNASRDGKYLRTTSDPCLENIFKVTSRLLVNYVMRAKNEARVPFNDLHGHKLLGKILKSNIVHLHLSTKWYFESSVLLTHRPDHVRQQFPMSSLLDFASDPL